MDGLGDAAVPLEVLRSHGIDPAAQPILLGGSTHPGEVEILARVFLQCRAEFPSLRLILAPRHVERTRDIAARLEAAGLRVALRSAPPDGGAPPDCLLLDTTGELRNWYGAATVVFMGKSLTTNGGQNPVEPILAGRPVLFGPHMENFATLAKSLLTHGGAMEVADADALAHRCAELLRDAGKRAHLVSQAERVLAGHRGATGRTAALLLDLKSHAIAHS
jgi:3-deoxy-D-manno-octulosonic-acid transferase